MKSQIVELLKNGKIVAMPTDTIYGIVGLAFNPKTVEKIYSLRKRSKDKPMIILISSLNELQKFNIVLTAKQKDFLKKIWPNPISVILPCLYEKFAYLHRGKKSLAFRIPKNKMLLQILKEVGPLVAPSANLEKEEPAETIEEVKKYFGEEISFYVDGGKLKSKPSTIVRLLEDSTWVVLRKGLHKI
ncbi:threonylcarbamoyl-AMP synthase [Patescibacteria group bacterium]|nr:threonylcarbamoyl-AMP synthase [Patescibacteria group bacterium]